MFDFTLQIELERRDFCQDCDELHHHAPQIVDVLVLVLSLEMVQSR